MNTSEIIKSIINFLSLYFLFILFYTYADDGVFGVNLNYTFKAMISALGPVLGTTIYLKWLERNRR